MRYEDVVASLSVPTLEQTARFADHVAQNHSWYKHLPFFPPGASFVCFPNPQAGRGVRKNGGVFEVFDVGRGDYFEHHSRLATADYLDQFGNWDYWVDDNPRDPVSVDGPLIYEVGGGSPVRLPEELKRNWSCRLTAFLYPAPPMFTLRANELRAERKAFVTYAHRNPTDPDVIRHQRVVERLGVEGRSVWGDHSLWQLLEDEAQAQRVLLAETLRRVMETWSDLRRGRA